MAKTSTPRRVTPKASIPTNSIQKRASAMVRVTALKTCYSGETRRRAGDVFLISGEVFPEGHPKAGALKYLSRAMEIVPSRTPLRASTPNGEIERQHDEILGRRMAGEPEPDGGADADEENPLEV